MSAIKTLYNLVTTDTWWQKFTIEINPQTIVTAQQKGIYYVNGSPRLFNKSRVVKSMGRIKTAMKASGLGRMPQSESPVALVLEFVYPYHLITKKERKDGDNFRVKRPDVDNLAKSVLDCITQLNAVWVDDSQVAILVVQKKYCACKEGNACVNIHLAYL